MNVTNYLSSKIANHIFGLIAYTKPTAVYIALYTIAPTASTPGTEVGAGLGYTRQSMLLTPSADGTGNPVANVTDIIFGPATSDWGTIVAIGIHDDPTGGNLLLFDGVTPQAVLDTQPFAVRAGQLSGQQS